MTLILNYETKYPIEVKNISYNINYATENSSRYESLSGQTTIAYIDALNHFENMGITHVALKNDKESEPIWSMVVDLELTSLNMYQDGVNSNVNFTISKRG